METNDSNYTNKQGRYMENEGIKTNRNWTQEESTETIGI